MDEKGENNSELYTAWHESEKKKKEISKYEKAERIKKILEETINKNVIEDRDRDDFGDEIIKNLIKEKNKFSDKRRKNLFVLSLHTVYTFLYSDVLKKLPDFIYFYIQYFKFNAKDKVMEQIAFPISSRNKIINSVPYISDSVKILSLAEKSKYQVDFLLRSTVSMTEASDIFFSIVEKVTEDSKPWFAFNSLYCKSLNYSCDRFFREKECLSNPNETLESALLYSISSSKNKINIYKVIKRKNNKNKLIYSDENNNFFLQKNKNFLYKSVFPCQICQKQHEDYSFAIMLYYHPNYPETSEVEKFIYNHPIPEKVLSLTFIQLSNPNILTEIVKNYIIKNPPSPAILSSIKSFFNQSSTFIELFLKIFQFFLDQFYYFYLETDSDDSSSSSSSSSNELNCNEKQEENIDNDDIELKKLINNHRDLLQFENEEDEEDFNDFFKELKNNSFVEKLGTVEELWFLTHNCIDYELVDRRLFKNRKDYFFLTIVKYVLMAILDEAKRKLAYNELLTTRKDNNNTKQKRRTKKNSSSVSEYKKKFKNPNNVKSLIVNTDNIIDILLFYPPPLSSTSSSSLSIPIIDDELRNLLLNTYSWITTLPGIFLFDCPVIFFIKNKFIILNNMVNTNTSILKTKSLIKKWKEKIESDSAFYFLHKKDNNSYHLLDTINDKKELNIKTKNEEIIFKTDSTLCIDCNRRKPEVIIYPCSDYFFCIDCWIQFIFFHRHSLCFVCRNLCELIVLDLNHFFFPI